jgi:hypothetical protein
VEPRYIVPNAFALGTFYVITHQAQKANANAICNELFVFGGQQVPSWSASGNEVSVSADNSLYGYQVEIIMKERKLK